MDVKYFLPLCPYDTSLQASETTPVRIINYKL